jgi:ATP-dependent exoDNAse (exonuclease V) beta subunit
VARAAEVRAAAHARARRAGWAVSRVTGEHAAVQARAARLGDAPGGEEAEPVLAAIVGDTPAHHADAGAAWGALIHGLLEHAARDRGATREDLARLGTWLTVDSTDLRPLLPAALDVVERVVAAGFFREARQADASEAEVPFAVLQAGDDGPTVIRGVIDLVHSAAGGWRIIDYKTDQAGDPAALLVRHGGQLRAYLDAFARLTGAPVEAGVFGVRSLQVGWLR